jgi:hypothetical protein
MASALQNIHLEVLQYAKLTGLMRNAVNYYQRVADETTWYTNENAAALLCTLMRWIFWTTSMWSIS